MGHCWSSKLCISNWNASLLCHIWAKIYQYWHRMYWYRSLYADRLKDAAAATPSTSVNPLLRHPSPHYGQLPTVEPLPSTSASAKLTQRAVSVSTATKKILPGLYSDLLDALKALKPNSVEAEDALHEIQKGEHGIWKLHHHEQLCCYMRCFSTTGANWSVSMINVFSRSHCISLNIILWIMQGHFRKTNLNRPGFIVEPKSVGILATASKYTTISALLAGPTAHDTLDLLQSSRCGTHGTPRSICPAMNQIGVQCWRMISCKLSCSICLSAFSLGLMTNKGEFFLSLKHLNTVSIVHIHHLNHVICAPCSDRPQEHEEIWLACHSIGCCWETCFAEWRFNHEWYVL